MDSKFILWATLHQFSFREKQTFGCTFVFIGLQTNDGRDRMSHLPVRMKTELLVLASQLDLFQLFLEPLNVFLSTEVTGTIAKFGPERVQL